MMYTYDDAAEDTENVAKALFCIAEALEDITYCLKIDGGSRLSGMSLAESIMVASGNISHAIAGEGANGPVFTG